MKLRNLIKRARHEPDAVDPKQKDPPAKALLDREAESAEAQRQRHAARVEPYRAWRTGMTRPEGLVEVMFRNRRTAHGDAASFDGWDKKGDDEHDIIKFRAYD